MFTHPTLGGAREDFRGSQIQKSGNVMNSPKKKIKTHPTPGGSMWGFRGGGWQKFKSPGNVMNCQRINNHFNPHPTLWLGVLGLNISKREGERKEGREAEEGRSKGAGREEGRRKEGGSKGGGGRGMEGGMEGGRQGRRKRGRDVGRRNV